jgi:ferric-dicitrate binding protein FerR (iron transport regulator)
MAIKGKGKTKGRQPARAPRRAPVEVKPPFFMRRRVQVVLAFVAGILAMMLAVWITNGLRQQRADDKAATEAAQQRAAGQKWKTQVESEFGKIGTISPGAPPAPRPR